MFSKKTGERLESYVQYVYQRLLNLNDYKNVIVSRNVSIKGISGTMNEFDIYYQIFHLNLECRVVIECKDWKTAVPVGEVRDFACKIDDIGVGNVIGVMISKNGYQKGADTFAKSKGIKLMKEDELPKIPDLLAGFVEKFFLPDEKCKGEPFWTIMECENERVTGSYMSISTNSKERPTIPLFYSKKIAEFFLDRRGDKKYYCIRGVTQYQLKGLLEMQSLGNPQFAVFYMPILDNSKNLDYRICEFKDIKKWYIMD
ncbi:MAG: restriction endonuclease [Clostridium sp.]|nr:restriction endonuclease [Clostridium sp.]MCM1236620.1 restriction endonuclease [Ruminococcus flavefaciens]